MTKALSVTPDKKYAEDGGPSTPEVLRILRRTTDSKRNIRTFAAMLFFNYLLGAPDAHAKNYSLLHLGADNCVLAPLYDVASGLPYDLTDGRPLRMAMSIGGENRLGHVKRVHVERFAQLAELESQACLNLMANLCQRIIRSAGAILAQAVNDDFPGAEELAKRMLPRLESHCRQTLQQLR